jgi:hypothetical protein
MSEKLKPYKLGEVKRLIREGKWVVNPDVKHEARQDFDWGEVEIKKAMLGLNGNMFYKTDYLSIHYPTTVDVYKACRLYDAIFTCIFISEKKTES